MKRILLIGAFVCLAVSAHAQVLLKQSTATTVNGKLTKIADGTDHTGLTVTSITLKIIKHSDTLASTVTSVACAASGSSNDCVEIASSGVYNAELSTGNTDTLGRLDICFLASGDYTDCTRFMVVDPASYNANVTGSLTSAAGIWAVATSTLTGAGTVGKEVVDALPSAVPGANGGLPTVNASNFVAGIQSDGITASSIAANAINAAKIDPDVAAELQTGIVYLKKNVATTGNRIHFWPTLAGAITKNASGVTCQTSLDGAAFQAVADTPAEVEGTNGAYFGFDITQAQTNGQVAEIICSGTLMDVAQIRVEFQQ